MWGFFGGGDKAAQEGAAAAERKEEENAASASKDAMFSAKDKKFAEIMASSNISMDQLKEASWTGVPQKWRPIVWRLLLGYCPSNKSRREDSIRRKRHEYAMFVQQHYNPESTIELTEQESKLLVQILKDVRRVSQGMAVLENERIQECLQRILYIWAIRNPASGYVQGIDGLVLPFFLVFLSEHVEENVETCDINPLFKTDAVDQIEADCFWCLSKMLDKMYDHYTAGQPGLQRMTFELEALVKRTDATLHAHLEEENLKFELFSPRWMNCQLMRELPLQAIIRLWDTYLVEEEGFTQFHVYVCASFLLSFSAKLQDMDFEGCFLFIQDLPTKQWGAVEAETLLSQAFMLSTFFQNAQSHLR
jgi:hypothetical protein